MGRGIHRGFITHEELNKSLGKRNLSQENLDQAFIHILDEKIILVEKKSDFKVLKKRDSQSKDEGKSVEKSDDPKECICVRWEEWNFYLEREKLQ